MTWQAMERTKDFIGLLIVVVVIYIVAFIHGVETEQDRCYDTSSAQSLVVFCEKGHHMVTVRANCKIHEMVQEKGE